VTEIAVLTRVQDGRGEALRAYIRGLESDVFTNACQGTHMARLVTIELDGKPHLLFTSRFDGVARDYLGAFVKDPHAVEIWKYCTRPREVNDATLLAHLLGAHAEVPASYVVALAKTASVARINTALDLQARLVRFAREAEGLNAAQLAQEFWELEPVREVLET
jgi:hypothetical protein